MSRSTETVRDFAYLADPLFVGCLAAYALNRWVLKPLVPNAFSQGYFNDLICIPFWVPLMLAGLRTLGLRRDAGPPRAPEILIPLVVWSATFEVVLPGIDVFEGVAFGDHLDVLCYALGALGAVLFWNRWYGVPR